MLRRALEGVFNQTYSNIEVIVIDDGSEPPLQQSIQEFDSNSISYHRLDDNQGANTARNVGIENSSGELIAFLDDDDQWERTKIELQVEEMAKKESIGVVYTGQRFVDESGETIAEKVPSASGDLLQYLLEGKPMGTFSCLMVRRSLVNKAGKPNPELPILQDREWPIRLAEIADFGVIEEPLVIRGVGDYKSIGDNYTALRDISVPYILDEYSEMAKEQGILTYLKFHSHFRRAIGGSALTKGHYSEARKYLLLALLYWPFSLRTLSRFFAASGGGLTYKLAKKVYR
jgi:glycosyltransferase involved in cell wall biosynthesis